MNKRIFIAIDLSQGVKNTLANQANQWLRKISGAKITPVQNLHLTLRFLGAISDQQMWESVEALEKIAKEINPFIIEGRGVVTFPSFDKSRIISCELEETEELGKLNQKIGDEFDYLNIGQKTGKKFIPHITLARLKKVQNLNYLSDKKINLSENINTFQLIESDLSGKVPEYHDIQIFKL